MSVYYKEKPEYLMRSLKSIWDEQVSKPFQIVLVEDGVLTEELYCVIKEWKSRLSEKLKIVTIDKNIGLALALNEGLKHCECDIIARMDSDDISHPNRFEVQVDFMNKKNVDVLGSWVYEFDDNEGCVRLHNSMPEHNNDIVDYAKKRNPIYHPSVMFKKKSVLEVGGYKNMLWFEDYFLWVRMMNNGSLFYNITQPLISVRSGVGLIKRRRGIEYAKKEYDFLTAVWQIGFLSNVQYTSNVISRLVIRMLPENMITKVYKYIRKS